jgi:hypothetical protein
LDEVKRFVITTTHFTARQALLGGLEDVMNTTTSWTGEIQGINAEVVLVSMSSMRWYCGYLDMPIGHPWHGLGYDDIEAEVHGGLTYSNGARIGFDCNHHGDSTAVQNIEYVRNELESLAKQAIQAGLSR